MLTLLNKVRSSRSVQNALWMIMGFGGRIGLQGVYFILLARGLGVQGFGLFSGAFALINIIGPFAIWGSGNLLVMNVSRDHKQYPLYFGNALLFLLGSGLLFTGLVVLFGGRLLQGNVPWIMLLNMCVADLFFARLLDLCGQVYQAFEQLKVTARLYLLSSGARLAFVLGFLATGAKQVELWSYWYMAASVLAGVVALVVTVRHFGQPRLSGERVGYTLRHGMFFSFGVASTSVYTDVDKVLLTRFEPAAVNGAYSAAYRLISMAFTPVQAIVFSSNTALFREGAAGVAGVMKLVARLLPLLIGYCLLASLALVALSPLVPRILGPQYAQSVEVLYWMLPLLLLQSVNYMLGDALMGAGLQDRRSYAQVTVAVLTVIFNLAVVPVWSWRGAAVGAVLAQGVLCLAFVALLVGVGRRQRGQPPTPAGRGEA